MGTGLFSLRTAVWEKRTDSASGQTGAVGRNRVGRASCGAGDLPRGTAGHGTCQEHEAGCGRWDGRQSGHSPQNGSPGQPAGETHTEL